MLQKRADNMQLYAHADEFLYLDVYVLGDDGSISYESFMLIKHLCILIHIGDAVQHV